MGDFVGKYTKKTFLEKIKDNGWCIGEDDKYFFEEIYNRSYGPQMKEYDNILNYLMTNQVWDEKKHKDGIQFVKNSLDELLKSNKIDQGDYNVINNNELSDPTQEEIDEAKNTREEQIKMRDAFHKDFMDKAYKQGWSVDDNEVLEALYDYLLSFNGDEYEIEALDEAAYQRFMSYTVDDNLASEKLSAVRAFYNDINKKYLNNPKDAGTLKILNEVGINAILLKAMKKYEALAKENAAKELKEDKNKNISPGQKKFNQAKAKAQLSEQEYNSAKKKYRFDAQDDIKLKSKSSEKKLDEMMTKIKNDRVSNMRQVTYSFNELVALKDVILADLRNYRAELALTQANQFANFVDKDHPEGSREYREMTKALQNAIEKLESKDATIEDISVQTSIVLEKAMTYHTEKHKGIFGGPTTDNGIARDNIAFNIGNKLAGYNGVFERSFKEKFKPVADKVLEGEADNLNKLKFSEINEKITSKKDALEKQYKDVNIGDTKNLAVFSANSTRTEIDKKTLLTKVENVLGVVNFNPVTYKFPKPTNVREAARQYIIRRCIALTQKPLVSSEEVRDMQEMISGNELDKNTTALANNKLFKDVFNKSKDFYTRYSQIEDRAEQYRVDALDNINKMKREYGSVENYVDKHTGIGEDEELDRIETCSKNLAKVFAARILSDPQNKLLRFALALQPDKEKLLNTFLYNYAIREVKRISKEHLKEILNTKDLNKRLINGFAEEEKRYARENKMSKNMQNAEKTANEVKKMIGAMGPK